jgi:Zn-finger nucleic acid-binding protein
MHSAFRYTPASSHQVDDQHHQRHNEEQVEQTAAYLQAKAKQPQKYESN